MRLLVLGAITLVVASCGDNPVAPLPGRLDIRLESPHADDGALLFVVDGAEIDSVESAAYPIHQAALSMTGRRVIITGQLSPGVVAYLWVPDIHAVGRYHATIEQVAQLATFALRDTAGYKLRVTRRP